MGIHVHNVFWREVRFFECLGDGSSSASTLGVRLGNMVAVAAQTGTGIAAKDCCATCSCMSLRLQDDDSSALAHDEAVTVNVVGARGCLRVIIPGGECSHLSKARHGDWVNCGLGSTSNHDVSAPSLNHPCGIGNRFGTRGTGAYGGVNSGAGSEFKTNNCSGTVGHNHGDHVGRDFRGAAFQEGVVGSHE